MQAEALAGQDPVAGSTGSNLDVLLIRLGERSFGVPLDQVRYVAAMPPDFVGHGAKVADHFVFEGTPLSYVSLWDHLGETTCYAEYEEMLAMLPQRRQDHLDWMKALEDSIRDNLAFAKARDPRDCAFGKWYYAYQSKDRRLALLLAQFERPHAVIHGLADTLLGLVEQGQGHEAMRRFEDARDTTLAKLMQLFDAAQHLVIELQRRIAIVVADERNTCALGADGIRDIVNVPAAHVKHSAGGLAARSTSGLIVLDERNVVPLINWRGLSGAESKA